ncbi:unnamed protein product [Mytilus coruscus]|uniref:Uncharacterized protein n=1 Tax=Mytilus coruscus TaxID=42192 RepID=A0A6J8BU29_MYTCO|nr:unnamed protein product [Mytilus coruscus]
MHQFCVFLFVFYCMDFNITYAAIKTISLPPSICSYGEEDYKVNPQHSYRVVYNGGKVKRFCALLMFYGFSDDKDYNEYTHQKCISMEVFNIDCGSTNVTLEYRTIIGTSSFRSLKDTVLQHTYSCNDQLSDIPEFCTTNSSYHEDLYIHLVANENTASRIVFNVRSGDKYELDCNNTIFESCKDQGENKNQVHDSSDDDSPNLEALPYIGAIAGVLLILAIPTAVVLWRRYRRRKKKHERIRNVEKEVYDM